jgi:hypothetical protein
MLNVRIRTIPHHFQQYDTVGNYWRDVDGCGAELLEIRVSHMRDRRHEFLVALHELIEAFLCDWRRNSFAKITRFGARANPPSRARRHARPTAVSISSPSAWSESSRASWRLIGRNIIAPSSDCEKSAGGAHAIRAAGL